MRLLLVEDDLDLAALLRLVVGQAGIELELSDRVAGVTERARGVDGVITDGALLDGTADDVLAALGADPGTRDLPVVVCSVRPDAVAHPNIVGRLRKPLDAATLAGQLRELFPLAAAPASPPAAATTAPPTLPPPPPPRPLPAAVPLPATPSVGRAVDEETRLRQRGLQELEVRARLVGDAGAAVLCGDLDQGLRDRARVAAHRSIGLAGALGEVDLAAPAREAEQLLLAERPLELDDAVRLCEVAVMLEDGARARVDSPTVRAALRRERLVAGGRVVLVDDDELLVALVRRRLEDAGYEVVVHRHGGEALAALRAADDDPDVLLLDVDLPGLNGLAVLAGVVAADRLHRTRVVLATVHDNAAELGRARASRPDIEHLPKPYDLDQLIAVLTAPGGRPR